MPSVRTHGEATERIMSELAGEAGVPVVKTAAKARPSNVDVARQLSDAKTRGFSRTAGEVGDIDVNADFDQRANELAVNLVGEKIAGTLREIGGRTAQVKNVRVEHVFAKQAGIFARKIPHVQYGDAVIEIAHPSFMDKTASVWVPIREGRVGDISDITYGTETFPYTLDGWTALMTHVASINQEVRLTSTDREVVIREYSAECPSGQYRSLGKTAQYVNFMRELRDAGIIVAEQHNLPGVGHAIEVVPMDTAQVATVTAAVAKHCQVVPPPASSAPASAPPAANTVPNAGEAYTNEVVADMQAAKTRQAALQAEGKSVTMKNENGKITLSYKTAQHSDRHCPTCGMEGVAASVEGPDASQTYKCPKCNKLFGGELALDRSDKAQKEAQADPFPTGSNKPAGSGPSGLKEVKAPGQSQTQTMGEGKPAGSDGEHEQDAAYQNSGGKSEGADPFTNDGSNKPAGQGPDGRKTVTGPTGSQTQTMGEGKSTDKPTGSGTVGEFVSREKGNAGAEGSVESFMTRTSGKKRAQNSLWYGDSPIRIGDVYRPNVPTSGDNGAWDTVYVDRITPGGVLVRNADYVQEEWDTEKLLSSYHLDPDLATRRQSVDNGQPKEAAKPFCPKCKGKCDEDGKCEKCDTDDGQQKEAALTCPQCGQDVGRDWYGEWPIKGCAQCGYKPTRRESDDGYEQNRQQSMEHARTSRPADFGKQPKEACHCSMCGAEVLPKVACKSCGFTEGTPCPFDSSAPAGRGHRTAQAADAARPRNRLVQPVEPKDRATTPPGARTPERTPRPQQLPCPHCGSKRPAEPTDDSTNTWGSARLCPECGGYVDNPAELPRPYVPRRRTAAQSQAKGMNRGESSIGARKGTFGDQPDAPPKVKPSDDGLAKGKDGLGKKHVEGKSVTKNLGKKDPNQFQDKLTSVSQKRSAVMGQDFGQQWADQEPLQPGEMVSIRWKAVGSGPTGELNAWTEVQVDDVDEGGFTGTRINAADGSEAPQRYYRFGEYEIMPVNAEAAHNHSRAVADRAMEHGIQDGVPVRYTGIGDERPGETGDPRPMQAQAVNIPEKKKQLADEKEAIADYDDAGKRSKDPKQRATYEEIEQDERDHKKQITGLISKDSARRKALRNFKEAGADHRPFRQTR